MRDNERRALQLLDDVGHGKSFTRSGDAEQRLAAITRTNRLDELPNCFRLVALRGVVAFYFKIHKGREGLVPVERKTMHRKIGGTSAYGRPNLCVIRRLKNNR